MNTEKDLELTEDLVNSAVDKQKENEENLPIFETMLTNLNNFIITSITEEETNLEGLIKTIDRKEYHTAFYRKEFLEEIQNKFFDREYVTEPEKRLENIRSYVEDKTHRFELYLNAINFEVKDEEDIEMFEKNFLAQTILNDYTEKPTIKPEKVENFEDYKEKKRERFSNVLDMIDEEDKKDEEEAKKKKEFQDQINNAPLSEKIALLYDKAVRNAIEKDGEEEGLVYTYITDIYNPDTTKLDEANLYYNLSVIETLQSFNVIDWNFDTSFNNLGEDEFDLSSKHWEDILSEDISEERKHLKILDKTSKYAIYNTMVNSIGKDFNRDNLTKRDLKFKNLFADEKDETSSMEQLLIKAINKKSNKGDIVMITPDMKDVVDISKENGDDDDEHIKLMGMWKDRWMFQIQPENFKTLKGLEKAIIFIKKGNNFNINPEKPLVHFHLIDNPMLTKPKLKVYFNLTMKFFMANTTILFVEDMDEE